MIFSIISDFLCCFDCFAGTPGDHVHWNPVKAILWVNTPRRKSVTCLVLCDLIWSGADAIEWISKAFTDESALLKHELAYCLGQMQDRRAIPSLTAVLEDMEQEPMVRHEAGKAAHTNDSHY